MSRCIERMFESQQAFKSQTSPIICTPRFGKDLAFFLGR